MKALCFILAGCSIVAHAQLGPTALGCAADNCTGNGPPIGRVGLNATFVYTDLLANVQYIPRNGSWVKSLSGSTTTDASQLTTGTLAIGRIPSLPNTVLQNSGFMLSGTAIMLGGSYTISALLPSVIPAQAVIGPATAPTGTCNQQGQWVFSQDGHATYCPSNGGTWVTKI